MFIGLIRQPSIIDSFWLNFVRQFSDGNQQTNVDGLVYSPSNIWSLVLLPFEVTPLNHIGCTLPKRKFSSNKHLSAA